MDPPNNPIELEKQSCHDKKVLLVCKTLQNPPTKMTPKEFMFHFVSSENSKIAYLRRYWSTETGVEGAMDLVRALRDEINETPLGRSLWKDLIQEEATKILIKEEPTRGIYPDGGFQSSTTVSASFFAKQAAEDHDRMISTVHMPFLFNILLGTLSRGSTDEALNEEHQATKDQATKAVDEAVEPDEIYGGDHLEIPDEIEIVYEERHKNPRDRALQRARRVAVTMCSMLAFANNRRQNYLQLHNSVRFYACGVSERVQEYLNYLGLCSSRRTATSAMMSLAKESYFILRRFMRGKEGHPLAPTICIDNIDMEQNVQQLSVGNRSVTFRGTWGYVHLPDHALLSTLDFDQMNLKAYQDAIRKVEQLHIELTMFLPSPKDEDVQVQVWKSQIARVLRDYIAVPKDYNSAIPTEPPTVEKISHEKANIHMLKLMDASDNSAEGVGQVFQSILQQSGLTEDAFYTKLQPMDGDLGTVANFNCLRSQRMPAELPEDSLNNIQFQLGASHTLWNVASSIFTHHFGNPKDNTDGGAWQYLEALGFPAEKAIQKKNFTLMVNQMERVFEATIYYCLRVVMKTATKKMDDQAAVIPTARWNRIVDECYERFCSVEARDSAAARKCPKLSNTLIQLHDFSSVVECKRAMKCGDIGRLMMVWKKWSVMVQSIAGITKYSSYLPRMVLLLTVILPPSLAKYLRHNLLMSPTGRENHFVAKDFWLEIQNYWLKFFYNSSGSATQIDRLRDIFSANILLLQSMFQSLKDDCGAQLIYQSHKNTLSAQDLAMFTLMATNRDILGQSTTLSATCVQHSSEDTSGAQPPNEETPTDQDRAGNTIAEDDDSHYSTAGKSSPEGGAAKSEAPSKQPTNTPAALKKTEDTYISGMAKLRKTTRTKDPDLHVFKKHMSTQQASEIITCEDEVEIDDDSLGDEDSSASEDF
ncbi:hypothetical protein PSTT_02771 [Puccinia striiformis]|uniref:DUF6589 domain-containing protein n=1 Tax=Puccinia striiformis TaxID=27350 RepID=A0A2S4VYT3_9BASI|nr:hypothetical protein PSTT_02771 [Puccinia striiformis]